VAFNNSGIKLSLSEWNDSWNDILKPSSIFSDLVHPEGNPWLTGFQENHVGHLNDSSGPLLWVFLLFGLFGVLICECTTIPAQPAQKKCKHLVKWVCQKIGDLPKHLSFKDTYGFSI